MNARCWCWDFQVNPVAVEFEPTDVEPLFKVNLLHDYILTSELIPLDLSDLFLDLLVFITEWRDKFLMPNDKVVDSSLVDSRAMNFLNLAIRQ